jgi:signal transduction histidine kinase
MRSLIFVALGVIGFHFSVLAENTSNADQARHSDSLMAAEASDLAWKHSDTKPDSSYFYAKVALSYAEKGGFKKIEAYSLSDIGNYYEIQEEYSEARNYLLASLLVRCEYLDTSDIASGYNNIALLFNQWQQSDSAIHYFTKGLEYTVGNKYLKMRGTLLAGISTAMLDRGYYTDTEAYLNESIEIALKYGDENALSMRYQNLGRLYQHINRPNLALEYYQKAGELYEKLGNTNGSVDIMINEAALKLDNGDYLDAIELFEEAKLLSEKFQFYNNLTSIYGNLGYAYMYAGQERNSEAALIAGIELARSKGKSRAFIETGLNYLRLKLRYQRFEDALKFLPEVDAAITKNNLVQYRPEYYLIEAEVYAETNQYKKANDSRVEYNHLRDSLDQLVDNAQISLAAMESKIKDQKILESDNALQETIIEKQIAENKTKTLWLWSGGSLAIAIIFIFGLRLRNTRLKNKSLDEKKKSDQQLLDVLKKIDIQILEKQIEARKIASIRIGQDLHDSLGSKLAVVQMSLDAVRPKFGELDDVVISRLDQIEQLLEDSCDDVRNVAHDLMDKNLISRGLEKELGQFLDLINGVNEMHIDFIPMNLPDLIEETTQKEIVAIVRALTENVLRHAKASELIVQMRGEEKDLHVSMEDNGIGFDTMKALANGGRGISNVEQRTQSLGGEFVLNSAKGTGTSIMLQIPINT